MDEVAKTNDIPDILAKWFAALDGPKTTNVKHYLSVPLMPRQLYLLPVALQNVDISEL